MSMSSQPKNPQVLVARVFIVVFFALLWLPLADSVFHWDKTPLTDEKRAPAAFPEYAPGVKPMAEYFAGWSAWYADHFGFRNQLVRLNNRWKRKWFKESPVASALIGSDGWLYYAADDMAGHARGLRSFTPEELDRWQKVLEARRDWLARRGIKYLFVVPPDKQTIYPEHLPKWLARTGPHDKLDQLLAHMKVRSTVEILDLRPALKAAKSTAAVYYNTDTHWNYYGGFVGYQELVRALGRQLPDLGEPQPFGAFDLRPVPSNGMDLAELLGQKQSLMENNKLELVPKPPLAGFPAHEDPSILPGKWEELRVPLKSVNPAGKYTMVMFRDSFAGSLLPYLGYNFKRVVYIFQPVWDLPLIEREKPDVVVDEILERLFNNIDTKRLRLPADAK